jgi:hypothetical protein
MEFLDILIIILLICCIFLWIVNLYKPCPDIKILYRYRPELDLQFSETNLPSKIYDYIFNEPNVFQGGYNLEHKKKTI